MSNVIKAASFFLLLLIVVLMPLSGPLAADDNGDEDRLVHYRYGEATNPRCGASKKVAEGGAIAVGAGLGTMLVGAVLMPSAPFIGAPTIAGGAATVAVGVGVSSSHFVCNWSFVRHPVLRFEGKSTAHDVVGDVTGENYSEGDYKECEEPEGELDSVLNRYKSSVNGAECGKEFGTMEEYFACLGNGQATIEEARRAEPICPKEKFKKVDRYAWPKNRVSSSRYIEVCYRYPTATMGWAPSLLFGMQFMKGSYTELLKQHTKYPREATYGDESMHKMKLALSGALTDSKASTDNVKCERMRAGDEKVIHTAKFRAVERGSQLCVDAISVGSGSLSLIVKPEIGCQMRPNSAPAPMCSTSTPKLNTEGKLVGYDNSSCHSCYVADVCKGVANVYAKSVFPVTSVLVSCIMDSLKNLLDPPATCKNRNLQGPGVNPGFLKVAQDRLKKTIMAVLTLAVMLFAVKAVMGGVQNGAELYMTVLKFALVIYFTQGSAMTHAYDYITKLSVGLSDIVLQAAGTQSICDFKATDYDTQHVYLMPWDRLDCRMMFYLGSQLNWGTGTGVVLTLLLCGGMLLAAVLINAKVIICLVALCAVIMLILVLIWTVYVFIVSFIAITVLTVISPLMIPMCLFQATKGFFDGWTRQLMTYALYPVILFAFLSLMFTVFDNLYFGDLEFTRVERIKGNNGTNKKIGYTLKDRKACYNSKYDSNLACMFSTVRFHNKPLFLGMYVSSPEFRSDNVAVWTKLGVFVLVGFLFYHFLSAISHIAGELAGDPRAGVIGSGSFNPRALANRAARMASSARGFATGKMSDLGGALRNRATGGGGGDEGSDKVSGGSGDKQGGAGKEEPK